MRVETTSLGVYWENLACSSVITSQNSTCVPLILHTLLRTIQTAKNLKDDQIRKQLLNWKCMKILNFLRHGSLSVQTIHMAIEVLNACRKTRELKLQPRITHTFELFMTYQKDGSVTEEKL